MDVPICWKVWTTTKKPDNRNQVIYHNSKTPQEIKIQKIIDDTVGLLPKCKEDYEATTDYQLLERAINEQTKNDKGKRILKTKEDAMPSDILQNPSDPDATYRFKAGKSHKGYSANIVEAVDAKGSVLTDYQYDVNIRSDASFVKEYIENSANSEESVMLITDGAYAGEENKNWHPGKTFVLWQQDYLDVNHARFLENFR